MKDLKSTPKNYLTNIGTTPFTCWTTSDQKELRFLDRGLYSSLPCEKELRLLHRDLPCQKDLRFLDRGLYSSLPCQKELPFLDRGLYSSLPCEKELRLLHRYLYSSLPCEKELRLLHKYLYSNLPWRVYLRRSILFVFRSICLVQIEFLPFCIRNLCYRLWRYRSDMKRNLKMKHLIYMPNRLNLFMEVNIINPLSQRLVLSIKRPCNSSIRIVYKMVYPTLTISVIGISTLRWVSMLCTSRKVLKASAHSFKHFTSRLLNIIFLFLYAPITSNEWHAWFHLNASSPAVRNTEQVNITKNSCPR